MKKAACFSAIIHVVVFLLVLFGMPNPFKQVIQDDGFMAVEFATIAPKTTAPMISNEIPEVKPDVLEPIAPQPKPEEIQKPEEKEIFEQKAQQAQEEEKKPEPVEEEYSKKPEPSKEEPKPEVDEESINLEKKKKEEKKRLEEEKKKKEIEDKKKKKKEEEKKKKDEEKKRLEEEKKKKKEGEKKAVVNLDHTDKKNVKSDKKKDSKKKIKSMDDLLDDKGTKSSNKKGTKGAQAEEISDTFTASEISKFRTHVAKCWNVHAGAKGAKDHIVDVEIHLSEDGYVQKAEIVDKGRMKSDPFYRVAAEAAQRSLLDPECNPLPIPKSDYNKWKELTFRFDPKDMF